MGAITISLNGDAALGTKTVVRKIGNNQLNRIVAWARAAYATTPTEGDPTPPALTAEQAITAWLDGTLAGTVANVRSAERDGAKAAVPEPADIPITV
jgi:hypothetical protein